MEPTAGVVEEYAPPRGIAAGSIVASGDAEGEADGDVDGDAVGDEDAEGEGEGVDPPIGVFPVEAIAK